MKCWVRTERQDSLVRACVYLLFILVPLGTVPSQQTSAQEISPQEGSPQETIHTHSNVVVIPALVKGPKDEIVYGLTARDFVVEDDGVEQPVHLDEAAEGQPFSLVIAIQRGGRANYEFPRIRGLSAMLDPLLESGLGRVAIVEFDSQVQLAQDFTGNADRIAESLKELQPGDRGAAIRDAVDYSVKLLEKVPNERQRVLLLISETRDHGSRQAKMDAMIAAVGQSSTAVYALAFSPSRSNVLDTMRGNNIEEMQPMPDLLAPLLMAAEAMKKNTPKTLASMTGGEYVLFASRKNFEARMIDFTNHRYRRYLLSIAPKNPHPGFHALRVRLRDPREQTVLARTGYWAAGTR